MDARELEGLRAVVPGAIVMRDGVIDYVFLPKLKVLIAGTECVLDCLLCPVQHGGYTTRLFLSERLSQRGQNWTVHNILGHEWHTWSWNNVPPTLPLVQILLAHLEPLR
jgi:hypothetical protein